MTPVCITLTKNYNKSQHDQNTLKSKRKLNQSTNSNFKCNSFKLQTKLIRILNATLSNCKHKFALCTKHFKSIMTQRSLADWQESQRSLALGLTLPSPGSTTLEDVLDSLLGLPSQPTRVPTPQPSPRKATSPFYLIGGKVYTFCSNSVRPPSQNH